MEKNCFIKWYNVAVKSALLKPDRTCRTLLEIDPDSLFQKGYDLVVLDADNTLVEKGTSEISLTYEAWINEVQILGIPCIICSNNFTRASETVSRKAGCLFINGAFKPFPWRFRRFLKTHTLNPKRALVIGDQIFTDILLGKWLGYDTCLVNPLSTRDWISTRILRMIEKMIVERPQ